MYARCRGIEAPPAPRRQGRATWRVAHSGRASAKCCNDNATPRHQPLLRLVCGRLARAPLACERQLRLGHVCSHGRLPSRPPPAAAAASMQQAATWRRRERRTVLCKKRAASRCPRAPPYSHAPVLRLCRRVRGASTAPSHAAFQLVRLLGCSVACSPAGGLVTAPCCTACRCVVLSGRASSTPVPAWHACIARICSARF